MANYNTFILYDCKKRRPKLVTSSARKANKGLEKGIRIDVWNDNEFVETVYNKTKFEMKKYIAMEKEYIAKKQAKAEQRNKRRKR